MSGIIQQAGPVGYLLLIIILFLTSVILYKFYYFNYIWAKKEPSLLKDLVAVMRGNHRETRKDQIFVIIEAELNVEKRSLQRYLSSLASVASIAPLLGLLGTILGMIRSTRGIMQVNNTLLLKGISEALVTTAIGIVIAVPAILAYNYFIGKTDRIIDEIKEKVLKRLDA